MRNLIMLVALAGLAAVALTATPAGARPPGVNGQILFTRFNPALGDTQVYVVNPDGSGERLIEAPTDTGECPLWSPDGTRISVCGGPPGFASRIYNPDDGSHRDVPSNPAAGDLFLPCGWWSSDGTRLYCEGLDFNDPSQSRTGIYSVRASDGGGLIRVTSNPGGDDIPGDFSPNADKLVFGREGQNGPVGLFVVNSNGTGLKQITPTGTIFTSQGDWSRQGNEIIFSEHATPDSFSSIWVVHTDGTGLHEIHIQTTPACGGLGSDPNAKSCARPSWSPDGKQIVFSLFDQATGRRNIYTANADGSNVQQVTTSATADDDPDWSTHPLVR